MKEMRFLTVYTCSSDRFGAKLNGSWHFIRNGCHFGVNMGILDMK